MMAETLVENQICQACGTDIRKGALFCYHCGEVVAPEIITPKTTAVVEENGNKVGQTQLKSEPIPFEEGELIPIKKTEEISPAIPAAAPETNLKSAASLRKKPKIIQNKKTEITWQGYENTPNVWFILTAVGLLIFAAAMIWLALYS